MAQIHPTVLVNPARPSRDSSVFFCSGLQGNSALRMWPRSRWLKADGSLSMADGLFLRHGRIGARLAVFERRQNGAQRRDQLVTGDVTFAELDSQAESLALRLEVKNERLGPRAGGFFFAALAASFIAGQAALSDAVHGLNHFLLGRLAGHLEQQRFENNALIRAAPAQRFGDIAERKRLRNRRASLADLAGDVVVSIVILRGQAVQPFGLLERRQVFALEVFD